MSLLTVIANACDRLSLTRPSAVVTSTDLLIRQLFGIANESGIALSKRGDPGWQSLIGEWTFITTATATQANTPIPPDFRAFVPDSFFNRTSMRPVTGPLTSQQWQLLQARPALSTMYLTYRERAGNFLIGPTPPAGQVIAYEYVSAYWAKSSASQAKAQFTSDDDGTYLDEELLTLDIKWRWLASKGLEYAEDMATAEREIAKALGGDGGAGALNIGGPAAILPPDRANVPESGFGL